MVNDFASSESYLLKAMNTPSVKRQASASDWIHWNTSCTGCRLLCRLEIAPPPTHHFQASQCIPMNPDIAADAVAATDARCGYTLKPKKTTYNPRNQCHIRIP